MSPPEKTVIEGKIIHLDVFDPANGFSFTLVYRDGDREPWAKISSITGFIKDKEYELIKDRDGRIDYLSQKPGGICTLHFTPTKGQRIHEAVVDLAKVEPCGVASRGAKLADKAVQKVVVSQVDQPKS